MTAADFHEGDLVYVPELGTTTVVRSITAGRNMVGELTLLGYETDFGLLSGRQMRLVRGGGVRADVEMYLKKQESK